MKETFFSIKPKDELLEKLIDHYYFQDVFNEGGTYSVLYYPHYKTALNYYGNAEVTCDNQGRTITQGDSQIVKCFFTQNIKSSRYVTINGSVCKIGIVFKPLGINHFVNDNLTKIAPNSVNPFDHFGNGIVDVLNSLKMFISPEEKRDCLDKFFHENYSGFEDLSFKRLIESMIVSKEEYSVSRIASVLNVNRKTVLRKFRKHLCTTPSEFISLIKFRNALHQYNRGSNLTHIAHDSNYYDQSDFIKHYKKIVGLTPKQLFKRISEKGENETLWTTIR